MTTPPFGLVLGRFQPPHLGHLEYMLAARDACERLVVGITNPDIANLTSDTTDPKRGQLADNPFTFAERLLMIEATLRDAGLADGDFVVVPAPVDQPDRLLQYLPHPEILTVYTTIYDPWGERKTEILRGLGLTVRVLWRRDENDRPFSGTEVRRRLRAGAPDWVDMVTPSVVPLLEGRLYGR